jgi:hypothetical protein
VKLLWTRQGWDDYLYWQGVDAKMVFRINELIRDMRRSPFQGIGNCPAGGPDASRKKTALFIASPAAARLRRSRSPAAGSTICAEGESTP